MWDNNVSRVNKLTWVTFEKKMKNIISETAQKILKYILWMIVVHTSSRFCTHTNMYVLWMKKAKTKIIKNETYQHTTKITAAKGNNNNNDLLKMIEK